MSNTDSQRVPCTKCGTMALAAIVQANNGLCGKCRRTAILEEEFRARQTAVPPPLPPSIDIRVDESRYDKQQLHLIREIVRAIKSDLAASGIREERLADVTGDVAFSIAAIIDGSRVMEADGQTLIPVLTFADDADRTKLVARPGSSFMHEYVHGTVEDVFDKDEAEPDH
jgi:hypothetical protein